MFLGQDVKKQTNITKISSGQFQSNLTQIIIVLMAFSMFKGRIMPFSKGGLQQNYEKKITICEGDNRKIAQIYHNIGSTHS